MVKNLENAVASSLDLAAMEKALQKDQWIKNAEMFFDNNNVLQVKIVEREPIARIFTTSGASFYMDSSLKRLPLSDNFLHGFRCLQFSNRCNGVDKSRQCILLKRYKIISEFITTRSFLDGTD